MKTCYNNIVLKYPISFVVSILLFLLYMFLPLVFVFLICSVLLLAFAVVVYIVLFRADLKGFENVKGYKTNDEKTPIVKDDDIGKNCSVLDQSHTIRRRNIANDKDRKDYTCSSIKDQNVTAVADDNLNKANSANEKAGPSFLNSSPGVASPTCISSCIKESAQFSGVKEDEHEDTHKAVDWSIDDQMNLGRVDNSEIERNIMLEYLFARRKARKLTSIRVRNTLMSPATKYSWNPTSAITIERKKPFLADDSDTSPIPGSAPSVLLSMHNHFDIPYNPEEKKPILTTNSFQKEILAEQLKDSMFCRHERFNLGAYSPREAMQDQTFHHFSFHFRPPERCETSRVNVSDKRVADKLPEIKSTQDIEVPSNSDSAGNHAIQEGHASEELVFNSIDNHHEEDECEVKMEQNLHENSNDGSTSSSSSEDDLPLCTAHRVELLRSLSSLARKDIDVARDDNDQESDVLHKIDRLLYEKTKDNSYFGEKHLCHAPRNSLASDLQVEVSEVSSPQSTSSNEKSSIFDYYINKEATSGCEDMCTSLSELSREAINDSNSRKMNEIGDQDTLYLGFSRISHNLYPNTSDMPPEKAAQKDEISSLSHPLNLPESIQGQTTDFNPEGHTASDSIDAPLTYDPEHSTERLVAHTSNSTNLEEISSQEVNVAEETIVHNKNGNESFRYSEVIVPDAVAKVSITDEEIYCKSLEDTGGTQEALRPKSF